MIEQAMKFFQIKTENCLFIGDKATDEAAARKSQINFIYVRSINFSAQKPMLLY